MSAKRNEHFKSLQGSLMIARIVDGKRTTIRELGNQTSVELSVATESTTIKETKTGKRADAKILTTGRTVELSATTNELVPADVALAFGAELITNGTTLIADSAQTLISEQLGWQVPWQQLKSWVLGRPHNINQGRITWQTDGFIIYEGGWQIEYSRLKSYPNILSKQLPHKMVARKNNYSIKLSINQWVW